MSALLILKQLMPSSETFLPKMNRDQRKRTGADLPRVARAP
jgi:hypothetical protein